MRKIYYISILASLMASQSSFAATDQTDQEEKFLLALSATIIETNGIKLGYIKHLLFISNKIKGSDIEITNNTTICYCENGKKSFRDRINMGKKNEIFGKIIHFNKPNPATIFKKGEIIPFIQRFTKKKEKDLLRDSTLDEVYRSKDIIDSIKQKPVKIISKSDEGALTEDFDTFKKRNTSTESLWSKYHKLFLTIITLAVLLGILCYMKVFSTLFPNGKKKNKPSEKNSSSAQAEDDVPLNDSPTA